MYHVYLILCAHTVCVGTELCTVQMLTFVNILIWYDKNDLFTFTNTIVCAGQCYTHFVWFSWADRWLSGYA